MCIVYSCSIDNTGGDKYKKVKVSTFNEGYYELRTKDGERVLNDTVWYYKDSLLTQLETVVTYVKIENDFIPNQIINYTDNKCDSSRSIFYRINKINSDSFSFFVHSKYLDSVSLVLGDFNTSYNDPINADTFNLTSKKSKILRKPFYKRGRLSIYRKLDSTYQGHGLYVTPEDLGE